jgi:hypothetical protein
MQRSVFRLVETLNSKLGDEYFVCFKTVSVLFETPNR